MSKRIIVLVLAVIMLVCMFTGCDGSKTAKESSDSSAVVESKEPEESSKPESTSDGLEYLNTDSELPIVKDGHDVTLSAIITRQDGYGSDNPNDYWFIAWAQKAMNITLDVEMIADSALNEKKPLLFASGDLPDMLWCLSLSTTEVVTYGKNAGMLLDMKDYISKKTTPNIQMWFDAYPDSEKAVTCLDGGVYTLPGIGDISDIGDVAARSFINERWLTENNLKLPTTVEEYTEALRAYKKAYPDRVPLVGSWKSGNPGVTLLAALGYCTKDAQGLSPALRNGKVVIPAADAGYKDYLSIMKTYYEESLISRDFFTIDQTEVEALITENQFLASALTPSMYLDDPADFQAFAATIPLTSEFCTKAIWPSSTRYTVGEFAVSKKCKYPECAVRFGDFFFSNTGHLYKWSGPQEGSDDTLGMVKGWFVKEKEDGSWYFNARDVEDGDYDNRWVYYISKIIPSGRICSLGNCTISFFEDQQTGYMDNIKFAGHEYKRVLSDKDFDQQPRKSMMKNQAAYLVEQYPTILYFTEEQNASISDYKTAIDSYVETETAKFITGTRPLEEFDDYLSELESLGFSKYLKFYIDYYEQYK